MALVEASKPEVTSPPIAAESKIAPTKPRRGLFQTRVIAPLIHLLRVGATPRQLAWSLAVGVAIGINPIIGSTTLLCLAVAFCFRLNLVASQIANHLSFPIQLALLAAWLRAGQILFRTGPPPLEPNDLIHLMRQHPWSTAQMLWTWQWHGLVVWLLVATILTPLLAAALHPILRRLLLKLHQHPA